MIKGIYSAVSAMIAGVNRQALKTQNIANLDTPGFKQLFTNLQEFQQSEVKRKSLEKQNISEKPIGSLGLGVMTTETRMKFSDGALQATNEPLDFAIQGDGFFRVMTSNGERYTRDGRFICDAKGNLATVDGNLVLDSSGKPIQIPNEEFRLDANGGFVANGKLFAQLGIVEFGNPETQLEKDGGNLFLALEAPNQTRSNTRIHQAYLEMSNVNAVDMVISAKTYEAAQKMVQIQDELLGKSISTLGKKA